MFLFNLDLLFFLSILTQALIRWWPDCSGMFRKFPCSNYLESTNFIPELHDSVFLIGSGVKKDWTGHGQLKVQCTVQLAFSLILHFDPCSLDAWYFDPCCFDPCCFDPCCFTPVVTNISIIPTNQLWLSSLYSWGGDFINTVSVESNLNIKTEIGIER